MTEADHLRFDTSSLAWQTEAQGIERMPLAAGVGSHGDGDPGFDIAMVRLGPGCSLPPAGADRGMEVLVCEGSWQLSAANLGQNSFARLPAGEFADNQTADGVTLLVRTGPFEAGDRAAVQVLADQEPWRPGQGNLRVMPLHSAGDSGTALVHWPAGERFQPHRHWGGEEIFVLSGTFEDEHGRYPTGTWMLSPHLSAHHPFVTEETIIFVKTGHLTQR